MGVKACSKNRCENIMCDNYINDVGYICDSCIEDLKTRFHTSNLEKKYIKNFMELPKDEIIDLNFPKKTIQWKINQVEKN